MSQKSVINMICLLVTVSNWVIIMIGSGGLLLVVSHLFAAPGFNIWVWFEKCK
jgi:hypothetical protein